MNLLIQSIVAASVQPDGREKIGSGELFESLPRLVVRLRQRRIPRALSGNILAFTPLPSAVPTRLHNPLGSLPLPTCQEQL